MVILFFSAACVQELKKTVNCVILGCPNLGHYKISILVLIHIYHPSSNLSFIHPSTNGSILFIHLLIGKTAKRQLFRAEIGGESGYRIRFKLSIYSINYFINCIFFAHPALEMFGCQNFANYFNQV